MQWTLVTLCALAAACSGQGLSSPTSLTSLMVPAALSQGSAGAGQTLALRGTMLPFHGTFTRESHAVLDPTFVITGTQTGTATHLGQFTAASEDRVDTNNTAVGTFDFTAANGDQLFSTTIGTESAFIPPNISKVTLTATIVDGTGRFAGATGSFTIELTDTIDLATNSATGFGSFEGHISLNR